MALPISDSITVTPANPGPSDNLTMIVKYHDPDSQTYQEVVTLTDAAGNVTTAPAVPLTIQDPVVVAVNKGLTTGHVWTKVSDVPDPAAGTGSVSAFARIATLTAPHL